MLLATTTIAPKPVTHPTAAGIDEPSYLAGEQPYRHFLSDMSTARQRVDTALNLLTGQQLTHLQPGDYLARSLTEARQGVALLESAVGKSAPEGALDFASAAIDTLMTAITIATTDAAVPVDPSVVADLYRTALGKVDESISHATFMFAL